MTPKEKALQLVNEFSFVGLQQREEGISCALIAVEEILNAISYIHETYEWVKYWEQVKTEIEKL